MYKFGDDRLCLGMDTNLFFDKYEEEVNVAEAVDLLCSKCPAQRKCLAYGISNQEWGVWGGVYIEQGKVSREYNKHKNNDTWFKVWSGVTLDKEKNV
jgi:hypothetical protein